MFHAPPATATRLPTRALKGGYYILGGRYYTMIEGRKRVLKDSVELALKGTLETFLSDDRIYTGYSKAVYFMLLTRAANFQLI